MDAPTLITLAILAALVAAPIVALAVRHRRRVERDAAQEADSMRDLLALAIPVLSPGEVRAAEQARRLQRERDELDSEAPEG